MTKPTFIKSPTKTGYTALNGDDFHQQVAEGLRRAPIERSIAIRSFWNAMFK